MILLRFSPGRFPLRKFSSSSSKDIPSKIPVAPSLVQKKCEIVSIPLISATTRGNPKENIQFFVRSWTVTTGQSPLVKKMQNIAEWDETKEKPHKIKATIDKWVDWGGKYWERLGKSKEGSFKRRIYSTGNYLLDRIDADEYFLKEITGSTTDATVLYPSLDGVEDYDQAVKQRFNQLLQHRLEYHKKWFYRSIYCIPFSMLMGILPGPNVFLAFNLFRVYSHDKAYHGATRLKNIVSRNALTFQRDDTLTDQLKKNAKDSNGFISDETIEALRDAFGMPEYFVHDAKRARSQLQRKLEDTISKSQSKTGN